ARVRIRQFECELRRPTDLRVRRQLCLEKIVAQDASLVLNPLPRNSLAAPMLHRPVGQRAVKKEQRRIRIQLLLARKCAFHSPLFQPRDTRAISQDQSPGPVLTMFNSSMAKYVSSKTPGAEQVDLYGDACGAASTWSPHTSMIWPDPITTEKSDASALA